MTQYDLIIDTSIFGAAVGIGNATGGCVDLLFCRVTEDIQSSARQLPLMVDDALRQSNISLRDISRVIVSRGPGSFTGIRVGIAYAFGFFSGLSALGNPLAKIGGVSSLETLAVSISRQIGQDVVIFLPATKTTGFAGKVVGRNSQLCSIDIAGDRSAFLTVPNWFVVGDWDELCEMGRTMGRGALHRLDARDSARLAVAAINARLVEGDAIDCSHQMPEAIYLRKSTVEEKASAVK